MSDTHESFTEHAPSGGGSDRSFGIVLAIAFLLLAIFPLASYLYFSRFALGLSVLLMTAALVAPARLAPFNRLWTRLGLLLHRIVSPVMLAFIFFLVVTPTGLLMRLAGKDLLRCRFDRAAKTYWISRTPAGPTAESLKNQF